MTTLRSLFIKYKDYAESLMWEPNNSKVRKLLATVPTVSKLTIADYGPMGTVVETEDKQPLYSLGTDESKIEHVFDMVIDTEHFYEDPLPASFDKPASEEIVLKKILSSLGMLKNGVALFQKDGSQPAICTEKCQHEKQSLKNIIKKTLEASKTVTGKLEIRITELENELERRDTDWSWERKELKSKLKQLEESKQRQFDAQAAFFKQRKETRKYKLKNLEYQISQLQAENYKLNGKSDIADTDLKYKYMILEAVNRELIAKNYQLKKINETKENEITYLIQLSSREMFKNCEEQEDHSAYSKDFIERDDYETLCTKDFIDQNSN